MHCCSVNPHLFNTPPPRLPHLLHIRLLSQEHKDYFQAVNPQRSGKLQPCTPLKAFMTF